MYIKLCNNGFNSPPEKLLIKRVSCINDKAPGALKANHISILEVSATYHKLILLPCVVKGKDAQDFQAQVLVYNPCL